jgi:hypothetical protein
MSMTNDDAVVDCIISGGDASAEDDDPPAPITRKIADYQGENKECSIPMCECESDPSRPLLRYCENGHYMHDRCIEYLFRNAQSLESASCPQCRSKHMTKLVVGAVPVEPLGIFMVCSAERTAFKAFMGRTPAL